MKTSFTPEPLLFQMRIMAYGNAYYIDRITALESILAKQPAILQMDLIGEGDIPADLALLMRSILLARSPYTQLITNGRSSLQDGAVLVWLMGDRRLIRSDARLFLRRAKVEDEEEMDENENGPVATSKYSDSYDEVEPEEGDYTRVLQLINEFLPVKEMMGRPIRLPVLRQFGLIENTELDHFLNSVLSKPNEPTDTPTNQPREKQPRAKSEIPEPSQGSE